MDKIEIWKQRIEEHRKSGLSQREWCRNHGIPNNSMTYWRNKISHFAEDIKWIEVTSRVEIQRNSEVSLEYDGFKIKVTSDTDEKLLKKVLRILQCI